MDEVLMDALVQKIEAFDKWSKDTEERLRNLPDHTDFIKRMNGRLLSAEKEIKDLPAKIFMPIPEIEAFIAQVRELRNQLAIPQKQEVRHEHHLTKPVWACVVMSLVIIGLLFLLCYKWFEADLRKENDLKYRYLQVSQPPEGQKLLHALDSQYTSNPDQFRKSVLQQEKIQLDSFEDFKQMLEKKQQINDLQEKWNQRPGKNSN